MRFLIHRRERAMWWYKRILTPLGMRFQKPLTPAEGSIGTAEVDEVLLLCRRRSAD